MSRPLLALAGASTSAFLALAVVVAHQRVLPLDLAVQRWAGRAGHPGAEAPMRVLALLGSGYTLIALDAVAYAWLRRAGHWLARPLPALTAGALAFIEVSKRIASRPRPDGQPYGFPSGHAFGSTVFFGAMIWLCWTGDFGRRWRSVGTLVPVLLILGIAYCRLYFNVHWLSDVVGGLSAGIGYLLFAIALLPGRSNPGRHSG